MASNCDQDIMGKWGLYWDPEKYSVKIVDNDQPWYLKKWSKCDLKMVVVTGRFD